MDVPENQKLIDKLVTLTGLPAPLLHREVNQMLELSGQKSDTSDLTLEQLREAMLHYLEALQTSYLAAEEADLVD